MGTRQLAFSEWYTQTYIVFTRSIVSTDLYAIVENSIMASILTSSECILLAHSFCYKIFVIPKTCSLSKKYSIHNQANDKWLTRDYVRKIE